MNRVFSRQAANGELRLHPSMAPLIPFSLLLDPISLKQQIDNKNPTIPNPES